MKSKRILSLILSVLIALMMLPGMVFAEEAKTALDGTLKIQGDCIIGEPLSADYREVRPQGLIDDYFTFQWVRFIEGEEEPVLLGTEKTYTPAVTDENEIIVLIVTPREDSPFTGELLAVAEKPVHYKPAEEAFDPAQDTSLFDGIVPEEAMVNQAEEVQENTEDFLPLTDGTPFDAESEIPADSSFLDLPADSSFLTVPIEETAAIPEQEQDADIPAPAESEEEALTAGGNAPVAVSMQDLPADEESEEETDEEDPEKEAEEEDPAEEADEEDPEGETPETEASEDNSALSEEDTEEKTEIEKASTGTEDAPVGEEPDLFDEDTGSDEFDENLSEVEGDWVGDDGEEEEYAGSFTLSTTAISFPDAEAGYSPASMQAQQFTVTNNGTTTLHMFMDTTSVLEYFDVEFPEGADVDNLALEPGQSMTFSVRPMEGLTAGTYEDSIYVDAQEVAEYTTVDVTFTVSGGSTGTAVLQRIDPPAAVTGLENGLSVEELIAKLPPTAHIVTTGGELDALVDWDTYELDYDPSETESQTFEVIGLVNLPSGVSNPDDIEEFVTISVTVNAGDGSGGGASAGYSADADKNAIYGVDPTGAYTTETRITFTAHGDGMDNTSPAVGDTRFIPVSWMVLESRNFDGEPFEASFRIAKAGGFTLTVTFNQQQYTSDGWVNTGVQDTKAVDFNVTDAQNPITITPGAATANTNPAVQLTPAATTRNAVATGDDTPIGAFVAILVVAVACIAGIIIYRKKRK